VKPTNSATNPSPTNRPQNIRVRNVRSVDISSLPNRHVAKASNPPFESLIGAFALQPRNDRVLIRRIEEPSYILLTDKPKSIKGIVLAVGPGKWHSGEWWKVNGSLGDVTGPECYLNSQGDWWEWIPGYRESLMVKPGDKVLFNSKWNDLANAENKGTGADGSGPLERPLSYKLDSTTHLIREADIFAIVPHFDFRASLGASAIEREHFINRRIAGPWSEA